MQLYQPTITGSLSVSGSINLSGSITIAGGGTISGTASIATNAITASSADNFLVRNTLTAQTLVVQTITSSVDFVTGSTRFGSIIGNTHVFTGSMAISGGLVVTTTSPELTVGATGVTLGNVITDAHSITGSVSVSGSATFLGSVTAGASISGYTAGLSAYRTYSKAAQFEISSYQSVNGSPFTKTMDIISNADSGVPSEMRFLTADSGSNPTTRLTISSTGAATFSSTIDAASRIIAGSSSNTLNAFSGQNNSTAQATIYAFNHAASGWAIYSAQGINYFANNVGIGTTSPLAPLDVSSLNSGGIAANLVIRNSASGNASGNQGSGLYFLADNGYSVANNTAAIFALSNTRGQTNGGADLYFATHNNSSGPTNKMVIQSGGNVGIGINTPAAKLHNKGSFITESSNQYGEAKSFVFQSVFNNPTINLLTINSNSSYGATMIRVTVYQNTVSTSRSNIHVGYANWAADPNPTINKGIIAPTVVAQFNGCTNVGTLAWSGNTLQYTSNRHTNYDGYVIVVEWGSNTDYNTSPTYGGNLQ